MGGLVPDKEENIKVPGKDSISKTPGKESTCPCVSNFINVNKGFGKGPSDLF